MNEGQILVGKLCRFWYRNEPLPGGYRYGICKDYFDAAAAARIWAHHATSTDRYIDYDGRSYHYAEAIEVRPLTL
jgi:hypothetical protein